MEGWVDIVAPPMTAGVLMLLSHIPLGRKVLQRGIIFLDLAIAQVAALGVVMAHLLLGEALSWQIQLFATLAALAAALVLGNTEKWWPRRQEALIGSLFVVSAALMLLLLSANPQGKEMLHVALAGQVLWVSWSSLWVPLLVTGGVVLVLVMAPELVARSRVLFYGLFALVVTQSVQGLGVLLVFATLIFPALATLSRQTGPAMGAALLIGVLGYGAGFAGSLLWDFPAGESCVCALAMVALLAQPLVQRLPAQPVESGEK